MCLKCNPLETTKANKKKTKKKKKNNNNKTQNTSENENFLQREKPKWPYDYLKNEPIKITKTKLTTKLYTNLSISNEGLRILGENKIK